MKQSNKEIKENLSTESKQKDSLKEIFEKFINELSICRPDIDTNMVDFEIIKKKTNQLKSEISQKIKELEKYKIKFNRLNNQFKELENEKEKGGRKMLKFQIVQIQPNILKLLRINKWLSEHMVIGLEFQHDKENNLYANIRYIEKKKE